MSTLSLFDRPGLGDDEDEAGASGDRVLRVSEVNRAVRASLEDAWGDVWIEGELSDVTRAASGHVYFTLNDEKDPAQLRGVMFRGDARRARARLERGAVVRMRGTLSLYEPRGSFQMIARIALPAGEGDLHAEFERIRRKLESEGLFDPARKRVVPRFPTTIGVVTSAAGAAMHDIVRVASERFPVRLVVADCRVQGKEAPTSIVSALREIQRVPELSVVIVGRGGGSAEDLWAFNYESVARAIASCRVPVVSAVGHEVDVTIADMVADVRASTPSNAAELVVPDGRALAGELQSLHRRMERGLETRIGKKRLRLERVGRRLNDPRRALGGVRRRLEALGASVGTHSRRRVVVERARLAELVARLSRLDPRATLARDRSELAKLDGRLRVLAAPLVAERRRSMHQLKSALHTAARPITHDRRSVLEQRMGRLDALSPLAVLARGYSIALHRGTGKALVRASDATEGDRLELVLHEGRLSARVEKQDPEPTVDD